MSQVNVPLHGVCERMWGGPSPLVRVVYPSETMLNGSLHARRSTGGNCSVPLPNPFLRRATAVGCTEMFRLQHNHLIIFVHVYISIWAIFTKRDK